MVSNIDKTLQEVNKQFFKVYVTDGSFEPLSDGFDFINDNYQVEDRLKSIFQNTKIQTPRCILIGTVFCCIVPNRTIREIQNVFNSLVVMMSELDIYQAVMPKFSNKWNDIKTALDNSCVAIPVDMMICKED